MIIIIKRITDVDSSLVVTVHLYTAASFSVLREDTQAANVIVLAQNLQSADPFSILSIVGTVVFSFGKYVNTIDFPFHCVGDSTCMVPPAPS
jgi:hypothetical protein